MTQVISTRALPKLLQSPDEGIARVPMHVFTDPEIYAWEQDLIFRGPTWSFLCLDVEIPAAGDYITTRIGDSPIIAVRRPDGGINALVNRCVHKGSIICHQPKGKRERAHNLVCPYHNWIYDFDGNLTSIAFEQGVSGKAGCRPTSTRLSTVDAAARRPSTASYSARFRMKRRRSRLPRSVMVEHIERTLHGKVKILGRYSQFMHNNWKLYVENSRDNYY